MDYQGFLFLVSGTVMIPLGLFLAVRGVVNDNVDQIATGVITLIMGVALWLPWVYRNYFA